MSIGSAGAKTRDGVLLVNSTLTNAVIAVKGPVKVYRVGWHVTVAKTTGTALVLTVQSVAGVTETALGTITSPDTMAVNTNYVKEFNPPLSVAEAQWMKIESTTAGNDGTSFVWVEYKNEPLTKSVLDTFIVAA